VSRKDKRRSIFFDYSGIDFPDDLARGVILVGIPFPPIYDRKIELKKSHLE
jgi:Rad3-related DNA helicase